MKNSLDYKEIGRRIRDRRLQMKWSQEQLSEATDLTKPHISHIENGHTKLSLPALVRIAAALNTTPNALLLEPGPADMQSFCREVSHLCAGCSPPQLALMLSVNKTIATHH